MSRNSVLAVFRYMVAFAFASVCYGQCGLDFYWTETDITVRQSGNTVMSYARTHFTQNGGIAQAHALAQLYRDGSFVSAYQHDQSVYGADAQANLTSTLYNQGQFYLGSYQLGKPGAPNSAQDKHWGETPYCTSLGYVYTITPSYESGMPYLVQRPLIRIDRVLYYLGSGVTTSNAYSSQGTLTVDAKGAPEIPSWSITSPNPSSFANLSCSICSTNTITAIAGPSRGCNSYDVTVQANFNGFPSETFFIDIRAPLGVAAYSTVHFSPYTPPTSGWGTDISYRVLDTCNANMNDVQANEVFTQYYYRNPNANPTPNWTLPLSATYWSHLDNLGQFFVLTDHLAERSGTNYAPTPMNSGTNNMDESTASEVTVHVQQFRIGSTFNGGRGGAPGDPSWPVAGNKDIAKGVMVYQINQVHYLDHGKHK